jgi:3-isopropylmalate/(R)-2-methylmalate dehydratase small subunit
VVVEETVSQFLIAHPGIEVTLDISSATLTLPDERRIGFDLEAFARHCLTQGVDELGFLLARQAEIEAYERRP